MIGVSGRLEVNVLYGFNEETTRSIVGVILGDESCDVSSETWLSAIGGLANVITSNAATKFVEIGNVGNQSHRW